VPVNEWHGWFGTYAGLAFVTVATLPVAALIETARYVLRLDRVSSFDDVLLNTAGVTCSAFPRLGRTRFVPAERVIVTRKSEESSR
jgi:hypothetical protein